MYYVNDGIYGSFNCILFDHYTVVPSLLQVQIRMIIVKCGTIPLLNKECVILRVWWAMYAFMWYHYTD